MRAPSISIELAGVVLAGIVLTGSLTPRSASADWPTLGREVSTAVRNQERPKVASDGAGGAIVVWQDARSKLVNVFARRVLASGDLDPQWPVDGRALLGDSTALENREEGQQFPVIVSDGAGGAIVAWQDGRSIESGLDIFAQHVLASGVLDPAWPVNGRALVTVRGQQDIPTIVSDGAGGAIVTWMDGRSGVTGIDIFAQHVLASGAIDPNWSTLGVALSAAPAPQAFPNITTDGSGGAIITWFDFRPSDTSIDVYAQHVTASGAIDPLWPANGFALSLAAGTQLNPTIVSDGTHGAIVTWEDTRAGLSHIFAIRVLGSGAIAAGWPADGLAVSNGSIDEIHPILTSDGKGGAIVTWRDARSGTNHNPFAQHILATGRIDPAWPVDGRALSQSRGEEVAHSIVGDGHGGAIVAWEEDSFIFAQHVLGTGLLDPTFSVNGRFIRLINTFQHSPDLTASVDGTAIVAWSDAEIADFDIYAMIVETVETLAVDPGTAAPGITFAGPSPNPARGPVTLSFALPRQAAVHLVIYDAAGRRVRELMSGTQPAGRHDVAWDQKDDGGRPVSAGIRFARLDVEGHALTQKVMTVR